MLPSTQQTNLTLPPLTDCPVVLTNANYIFVGHEVFQYGGSVLLNPWECGVLVGQLAHSPGVRVMGFGLGDRSFRLRVRNYGLGVSSFMDMELWVRIYGLDLDFGLGLGLGF